MGSLSNRSRSALSPRRVEDVSDTPHWAESLRYRENDSSLSGARGGGRASGVCRARRSARSYLVDLEEFLVVASEGGGAIKLILRPGGFNYHLMHVNGTYLGVGEGAISSCWIGNDADIPFDCLLFDEVWS
jgi:hypothetical protein